MGKKKKKASRSLRPPSKRSDAVIQRIDRGLLAEADAMSRVFWAALPSDQRRAKLPDLMSAVKEVRDLALGAARKNIAAKGGRARGKKRRENAGSRNERIRAARASGQKIEAIAHAEDVSPATVSRVLRNSR